MDLYVFLPTIVTATIARPATVGTYRVRLSIILTLTLFVLFDHIAVLCT